MSWRDNGLIDFHGRIDFQIKIRGFRVELGEIEAVLLRQPPVSQALVLVRGELQKKRLLAYVVLKHPLREKPHSAKRSARQRCVAQLRSALGRELPDYMLPDRIVLLDAMPLNANGKVDRAALPDGNAADLADSKFVQPENAVEKNLHEIWQSVLGHARFGVTDRFFSVGGDSILAIQIVSRAAKKGLPLTVRTLMEHGTIRKLATVAAADVSEQNPALAALSKNQIEQLSSRVAKVQDIYPATAMQEGMVLYSLRYAAESAYNTQLRVLLRDVDSDILYHSWKKLAQRHDVLRTAFFDLGQENLMQVVVGDIEISWREVEASIESDDAALFERHRLAPFDMGAAPLWRLLLVRYSDKRAELSWTHHHALLDGWSIAHLLGELLSIYEAIARQRAGAEPAGGAAIGNAKQFRDYIAWLQAQDHKRAENHWQTVLVAIEGPTRLRWGGETETGAKPRRQQASTLSLSETLSRDLLDTARDCGVTLSAVMQTAWGLLLSRFTGENRVLFGCSVSGRPALLEGVETIAGLFINSLPVVMSFNGEARLRDVFQKNMAAQACNEEYAYLSLAKIQQICALPHNELPFESVLVVENFPRGSGASSPGSEFRPALLSVKGVGSNNLPLNIVVYPGRVIDIEVAYDTALFTEPQIEQILRSLKSLLNQFAACADAPLSGYRLVDDDDVREIDIYNRRSYCELPAGKSVYDLFVDNLTDQAREVALVCGEKRLTFNEIHTHVLLLSRWLLQEGIRPGDFVAVTFEKDPAFIVAILSLLNIGAAYVPIAMDCPTARREFINSDAGIRFTLTLSELAAELEGIAEQKVIPLDRCPPEPAADSPHCFADANATAYVIYTSGTTGQPKGVKISQKNIINFCIWSKNAGLVRPRDAITQFAPFTFDASAGEIFSALLNGAQLHLLRDDIVHNPGKLVDYLHRHSITFSAFPPPYLEQIPIAELPEGMTILTAGSAPSLELVKTLAARVRYINGYGPTETTVLSTFWECNPADLAAGHLPIGKPIANTRIYVLDQYHQLCPNGVVGEICIGGAGLCQGYINRDELNRSCFIVDTWGDSPRLYRTGDLGRRLDSGDIEFVGRRDNQIKIRGFRVELGEIESQLLALAAVKSALVLAPGEGADKRIVAWVVAEDDGQLTSDSPRRLSAALKNALKDCLPPYMIPAIVLVDAYPLTANGKVDIKALPQPDAESLSAAAFASPTTEWQRQLAPLWAETLKLDPEKINVNSDFFELGGHSLLATRLCNAVAALVDSEVPVAALFENPSLAALALYIENACSQKHTHSLSPEASSHKKIASPSNATSRSKELSRSKESSRSKIVPRPRKEELPLSDSQRRLWFITQLDPTSAAYNMSGGIEIRGKLDVDALRGALNSILQRHEILRCNFIDSYSDNTNNNTSNTNNSTEISIENRGLPQQVLRESAVFPLQIVEAKTTTAADADKLVKEQLTLELNQPFDLARDSLVRGRLLVLREDRYALINTLHHIVSDGWSMGIFLSEMSAAYEALVHKREPDLPPLPIQYADYAAWQRQNLQQAELERHLSYWRAKLDGLPSVHGLALDKPRPPRQSYRGAQHQTLISVECTGKLRTFARENRATLFMVLYAGFSGLLSRYSGETDIVLGTPTANRDHSDLAPLIGFFANTLILRQDLGGDPPFRDMIQRAKQIVTEAYQHQSLPFDTLVEDLHPQRDLSYNPLFQLMISMISSDDIDQFQMPGLSVASLDNATRTSAKFDLTLNIAETGEQLSLLWNYATDLFEAESIERLAAHFVAFLEHALTEPDCALSNIRLLSPPALKQLLCDWNQTEAEFPRDKCIHDLFEDQVAASPEVTAVVFGPFSLSYRALNAKANQLAHYLIELGVKPGDLVGLFVERNLDMLVALLAILKTGAAYVPLDPRYPSARLAYLIEDARLTVLLTEACLAQQLARDGDTPLLVVLDDPLTRATLTRHCGDNISRRALQLTPNHLAPNHLAYVIYTSGSTGKPKGVEVEHRAVVNYITHMYQNCGRFTAAAVVSNPLAFDAVGTSLWQILKGVPLILLPTGSDELWQLAEHLGSADKPLLFKITPSHLTALKSLLATKSINPQPHMVVAGGEILSVELVDYWQRRLPQARFVNHYGPTEATTGCSHFFVPQECTGLRGKAQVPIGRPMSNRRLYILDTRRQPVPIGVAGELYIGGEGLARGYLNRPKLSAERFIEHSVGDYPAERLYQSGDLARYLGDGNIEFLGRRDQQLKIRGLRIECGEIEQCLRQHNQVAEAAVIAGTQPQYQSALIAYVVPVQGAGLKQQQRDGLLSQLRRYLAGQLPDYMVPSAMMLLEALPLTANGKLDRGALPSPAQTLGAQQVGADIVEAQTAVEKKLLPLWRQVLKKDRLSVTDNFFLGGGHSLSATELTGLIRQQLHWDIPLRALFEHPTLRDFSEYCEKRQAGAADLYQWLQASNIIYRKLTLETEVEEKRVICLIETGAERRLDEIKAIVNRNKNSAVPDYLMFAADPEARLKQVEKQGLKSLRSDNVNEVPDIEPFCHGLERDFNTRLFRGEPVDTFALTPMQKLMLRWKQRLFKNVISIRGFYSDTDLCQAFLQLQHEQELLRSRLNQSHDAWQLYPPAAPVTPVVDLRFQEPGQQKAWLEKLAARLITVLETSSLAYLAFWVRLSDTEQKLYIVNDHLIADKLAFNILANRLEMHLAGEHQAPGRSYRQYVASLYDRISEQNISAISAELNLLFPVDALRKAVASTDRALESRRGTELKLLDLKFSAIDRPPMEYAFSVFTDVVSALLGSDNYCITLNYHSRQLLGHNDFDQVGLFLDRIPFVISADSTLDDIDRAINFVAQKGISFSGIDEGKLLGPDKLLPEFGRDILFNFLGEDSLGKINAHIESQDFGNLRDFYGILLEAYTVGKTLYTRIVYRGDRCDVEKLKQLFKDNLAVPDIACEAVKEGGNEIEDSSTPSAVGTPLAIEVKAVKKRYGDEEAIKGISFAVKKGLCYGILGPNGAGKTSLLGMIEGITPISEGEISLLGMDVRSQMAAIQPFLGVQLQHCNYFDFLTVEQLLRFFQQLRSANGRTAKGWSLDECLRRVSLSDKKNARVEALSGGQKQRLSLVIALLEDPEVLFLDEPTSALDPHSRRAIWELIESLKKSGNKTIVLTTHHMEEAQRLCDELLILHRGRVISQGSPRQLMAQISVYHDLLIELSKDPGLKGHLQSWDEIISCDVDREESCLRIRAREIHSTLKKIVDYCRQHGVEVRRFEVNRPNLEDVFMHLTNEASNA